MCSITLYIYTISYYYIWIYTTDYCLTSLAGAKTLTGLHMDNCILYNQLSTLVRLPVEIYPSLFATFLCPKKNCWRRKVHGFCVNPQYTTSALVAEPRSSGSIRQLASISRLMASTSTSVRVGTAWVCRHITSDKRASHGAVFTYIVSSAFGAIEAQKKQNDLVP